MSYGYIPDGLLRDVKEYQQQVAAGHVDHIFHEHLVEDIKFCFGVPEAEYFDIHRDLPYFEARSDVVIRPFIGIPFLGAVSGSPHPSTPIQCFYYSLYSFFASVFLSFGVWVMAYNSALFPTITAWEISLLMAVPLGISWAIYLVTKIWFVPKDIEHRQHQVAEFKQLQEDYEQKRRDERRAAESKAEAARQQRLKD